jgi:hypothetical protein
MSDTKKRPYVRTLKAYIVTGDDEDRIVRAYTPTEALQYCMPQLKVRLASTDDIISLMAAGVPVESAVGCISEPDNLPDESAGLTD